MLPLSQTEPCARRCAACATLPLAVEIAAARVGVRALTVELLAEVAGLPEHEVRRHVGDIPAYVCATYAAAAGELQDRWGRDLWVTPCWPEGLAYATEQHIARLVAQTDRARFVYVEALGGDATLRAARTQVRARTLGKLVRYQRMVAHDDPPTLVRLELMVGAVTHTIEHHVRAGTLETLPAVLGDVLAAVEPEAAAYLS